MRHLGGLWPFFGAVLRSWMRMEWPKEIKWFSQLVGG